MDKIYVIMAEIYNGLSTSHIVYDDVFYDTKDECQKRCDILNSLKRGTVTFWGVRYDNFEVEELTKYEKKNEKL